jgi:hypothetical protein
MAKRAVTLLKINLCNTNLQLVGWLLYTIGLSIYDMLAELSLGKSKYISKKNN